MTSDEKPIYEVDAGADLPDPDETPIRDRKVVTQPYDLAVESLVDQVKNGTVFLRPLSSRPRFQRQYVWSDLLASRLIESILLRVPIPPCYLSQNEEYELDVIDGQQRIYSLYRFVENQFSLSELEVLKEISGKRFFELEGKLQRQLKTFSLRCILITNESHPEIKFDVFERLNTNTVPLNPQELRNCIFRGPLNELLGELSESEAWLSILGRRRPDKRLRDEELILRHYSFLTRGIGSYKTPQKHWLNETAKKGRRATESEIAAFRDHWNLALQNVLEWFEPQRAFRRPESKSLNRALFDLLMLTAGKLSSQQAKDRKELLEVLFSKMMANTEFADLISRSVDHKKRAERRFELWRLAVDEPLGIA